VLEELAVVGVTAVDLVCSFVGDQVKYMFVKLLLRNATYYKDQYRNSHSNGWLVNVLQAFVGVGHYTQRLGILYPSISGGPTFSVQRSAPNGSSIFGCMHTHPLSIYSPSLLDTSKT
jgi:hypothetical protein